MRIFLWNKVCGVIIGGCGESTTGAEGKENCIER
jgi:hypothetical protein